MDLEKTIVVLLTSLLLTGCTVTPVMENNNIPEVKHTDWTEINSSGENNAIIEVEGKLDITGYLSKTSHEKWQSGYLISSKYLKSLWDAKRIEVMVNDGKTVIHNSEALKAITEASSFVYGDENQLKEAIIDIESSGKPYVVNSQGCGGLFQFCPKTRNYVIKELGIPLSDWMQVDNQHKMFSFLFDEYKEQVESYGLPTNAIFLYGAWQQGPFGIKNITDTLTLNKKLAKGVKKGIIKNMSKEYKELWESKTRQTIMSLYNQEKYRKNGSKHIIVESPDNMSWSQKRKIVKSLNGEAMDIYKTQSDVVLATLWLKKFSNKIKNRLS